jgi:hypothetical protein
MRRVRAVFVAATAAQARRLDRFASIGRATFGTRDPGGSSCRARISTADLGADGDLPIFAEAGVAAVGIGDSLTVSVALAFDYTLSRWVGWVRQRRTRPVLDAQPAAAFAHERHVPGAPVVFGAHADGLAVAAGAARVRLVERERRRLAGAEAGRRGARRRRLLTEPPFPRRAIAPCGAPSAQYDTSDTRRRQTPESLRHENLLAELPAATLMPGQEIPRIRGGDASPAGQAATSCADWHRLREEARREK